MTCCGIELDQATGKYGCPNCCGDRDMPDASTNITNYRKKLNLTQQGLADLLGMHVQRINAFETGKRNPLSMEVRTAIRIAKALQTTVESIFKE